MVETIRNVAFGVSRGYDRQRFRSVSLPKFVKGQEIELGIEEVAQLGMEVYALLPDYLQAISHLGSDVGSGDERHQPVCQPVDWMDSKNSHSFSVCQWVRGGIGTDLDRSF